MGEENKTLEGPHFPYESIPKGLVRGEKKSVVNKGGRV